MLKIITKPGKNVICRPIWTSNLYNIQLIFVIGQNVNLFISKTLYRYTSHKFTCNLKNIKD